jgi:hypothetical protein
MTDMRTSAERDPEFRGIDIDALNGLIRQMNAASATLTSWLQSNGALPAGVPRTGLAETAAVEQWIRTETGMLARRRAAAVAHLAANADKARKTGAGAGEAP